MGRPQLTLLALTTATALLAAPRVALAQSAQDKAAAEAAFEDGKRLMAAHAYADACAKLAESQRLDPGIGTMLGLADCFEKNGQTASAWAEFKEAAGAAARKGDRREQLARDNAARLEPLLSKLVVRVPPEAEARGLVVKRDGVEVGRAEWGGEVPVDPGVHTIAAGAPEKKDWQTSVDVPRQATAITITVPRLDDAPVIPVAAPRPGAAAGAEDPGRTQKIAAVAVGAGGVVALVVGGAFGFVAKSKLDDSNAGGHCDARDTCDSVGLGLRSDAKSAALGSTIAFAVGVAAVGTGAVLWLTAPSHDRGARVGLAPGARGVGIVGVW